VLSTESYVRVRWSWLAFLAAQVAFSTLFLMGIMVQTMAWKVNVLKASASATLLAISSEGRGLLERQGLGGVENPTEMTRKLQTLTGKFTMAADRGWLIDLGRRGDGVT
jgi:hypothetical protein